ncbi:GMP synthase [glutamine-hydrolyzing] subunit A [Labeo rohita]|uniref:GMP synthase [glutamine-hydrolyzing] subunit A n=1 Tax=Labeo rohita TaxID=84645 RepID=A0ABQ8LU44_LABRO|nr:GMP synthase [glutamine-hydrolyzing] subunit A [Labeo rohita]
MSAADRAISVFQQESLKPVKGLMDPSILNADESFNHERTAGLTEVSMAWKKALLQYCLGVEGQRVLRTISDTTEASYDHESMHQYVADLRGLANSYKFGELHNEMIRDQLIEHTNNNKIRETLLLQPDDLTLSKAIAIAFQVESAAKYPTTLMSLMSTYITEGWLAQVSGELSAFARVKDELAGVTHAWHVGCALVDVYIRNYPVLIVDLVLMPPELKSAQPMARHVIIVENKIISPVSATQPQVDHKPAPISPHQLSSTM